MERLPEPGMLLKVRAESKGPTREYEVLLVDERRLVLRSGAWKRAGMFMRTGRVQEIPRAWWPRILQHCEILTFDLWRCDCGAHVSEHLEVCPECKQKRNGQPTTWECPSSWCKGSPETCDCERRPGEDGNWIAPQVCDKFREFKDTPYYCWCGHSKGEHTAPPLPEAA